MAKREKPTSTLPHSRPLQKDTKAKVWDGFLRLTHWSLVLAFAIAYGTGDAWRDFHVTAGCAALGLIAGRVIWGIYGSRYARFSQFVKSPAQIASYLGDVARGKEARYVGHNPAGGLMVIALLSVVCVAAVSGVLLTTDYYWGSETLEKLHGGLAQAALGLVAAHVIGVIVTSYRTRENLVWSMIVGTKRAPTDQDID
jgi:cytochrome b